MEFIRLNIEVFDAAITFLLGLIAIITAYIYAKPSKEFKERERSKNIIKKAMHKVEYKVAPLDIASDCGRFPLRVTHKKLVDVLKDLGENDTDQFILKCELDGLLIRAFNDNGGIRAILVARDLSPNQ